MTGQQPMAGQPKLTTEQKRELETILERIVGGYPIHPDVVTHVLANFAAEVDYWADGDNRLTLVYTGSRKASRERVRRDLDTTHTRFGGFHLLLGYNPEKDEPAGGDRHAHAWALDHSDVTVECHPARWDLPELAKAAGPYRNGYMIGLAQGRGGRHGMLAHLVPGSTGSAGAAAFAHLVGMNIWRPTWQ